MGFYGLAMGRAWALFLCRSALTGAMIRASMRLLRSEIRADAESLLLRVKVPVTVLEEG